MLRRGLPGVALGTRQDDPMGHVVLFHSVHGLRPAVLAAAERLRAAGHQVATPDLYGVPASDDVEEGFALLAEIGHDVVLGRAAEAVAHLPPETVLAGFSMGAGVAGALLAERPATAGLLLLHGTGGSPAAVRPGLPVQLHLADPDQYEPPEEVDEWRPAMAAAGARLEVFRYPGVGHLFTDPDVPDHDAAAAGATWDRVLAFLAGQRSSQPAPDPADLPSAPA
ncbi:dienelactone hydrolase family protein [Micromonospora avicenniae]|uniref:dienelactone hydrolase family protein n=1 Tax=Micromonospora avicenniae TaxID=1198245 RepID=UPI003330F10E